MAGGNYASRSQVIDALISTEEDPLFAITFGEANQHYNFGSGAAI